MSMKAPVLILSVILAGCASDESAKPAFKQLPVVTYTAPTDPPAPAAIFNVQGSVTETIDKVVESLNGPRFGITHVDRRAGIITATFEADPDDYLDCGELELVSSQGESQIVPAASRFLSYEIPLEKKTRIGSIDRKLALDGRLLIEVTQAAPGRSHVKVSGDYVLTRTAALKGTAAQTLRDEQQFLAFGSGQAVGFGGRRGGSTVCQSNGELEQQALTFGNFGVASPFDVAPPSSVTADAGTGTTGTILANPVLSPSPTVGAPATDQRKKRGVVFAEQSDAGVRAGCNRFVPSSTSSGVRR